MGYYPVTEVWAHTDPVVAILVIDGETIETTPEHPFYTANGDWAPAATLQPGGEVAQADGTTGTVESVRFVARAQTMYNFTVATAHTYFVGEGQWLVHNACGTGSGPRGTPKDAQRAVQRGQGPRDVKRIDAPEPSVPGSQWHAHQIKTVNKKNPALNLNGKYHDGVPTFSNKTLQWLKSFGWKIKD